MESVLNTVDCALRTVFAKQQACRAYPANGTDNKHLSEMEKRRSSALMRVNHVGEVCAQALYTAQSLATKDESLRRHLQAACREETDHLAWTEERLEELGGRKSLLNPLWYMGAFGIGFLVAKLGGDAISLGFVMETEKQVEAHLQSHMQRLPENDLASRAIVEQMKKDEKSHAIKAQHAGALDLPAPIKGMMRVAAKTMTVLAHKV